MSRKIILLRHGESVDIQPGHSDFDRILSDRGVVSVTALAKALSNENLIPDYFLASPAIRTKQTTEIILKELKSSLIPQFEMNLYYGDEFIYGEHIATLQAMWHCLLLVGHNPSISALIGKLSRENSVWLHPGQMAILEFDADFTKAKLIKTIGPLG